RGTRLAPARAPHVRPPLDTQQITDLRGAADGIALRVQYSQLDTYQKYRPDGALEDLIYEMLEQFRVEALASQATIGLRANLTRRFAAWSHQCIAEGLLENQVGLLLFTTAHVCRSRILAEPIEERVNDHTESTRFGIYEVMGPHLLALRPAIGDQSEFARHAAAIAIDIGALASAGTKEDGRPSAASDLLAMLVLPELDPEDPAGSSTTSLGRSRLGADDGYRIFTEDFDEIIEIHDCVRAAQLAASRLELEADLREHGPLAGYLRRAALQLFAEPDYTSWDSEQEEGYLDPRLLVGLIAGRTDGRLYRRTAPQHRPQAVVSILVDCSGSMKAVSQDVAALLDLLIRALDNADVGTELLGYSTGAWSGGRPYRQWLAAGRPAHPGRLNEVNHIVFKSASTPWRRARSAIAGLLWTPMFREGLDGEALSWAYDRLARIEAPRKNLLLISDGSPMDGATSLANGEHYLDRHLAEVASDIEQDGQVRLAGLGIGHDMSAYLGRSR
ncbi:MAG: cobaltochelatase CobT-related protein, partial [Actinomycetales bacterium]